MLMAVAVEAGRDRSDERADVVDALLATGRVLIGLTAKSIGQVDADVTLPQFRMLVLLAANGAQRTTDLAAQLSVTPSTVTRTCDRLVRRDLAQRFQRADDRRVAWIALTETGKHLIGDVMRRRRSEVERLTGSMEAAGVAAALHAFVRAAGELPEAEWWRRWEISTKVDDGACR
jgi:DNA-binding MarR family transcriptional regulator